MRRACSTIFGQKAVKFVGRWTASIHLQEAELSERAKNIEECR